MTIKQCRTCKYSSYDKYGEFCFLIGEFMSPNVCTTYQQGEENEGRKEFFELIGEEISDRIMY